MCHNGGSFTSIRRIIKERVIMDTPICDFVRNYAEKNTLRLHMPGHKGNGPLGIERLDITEFDGADSLYEADGIIKKSEENAGMLFGANTFYSAEGSSLCIRAMLYLAVLYAKREGKKPIILAGRNAHKTFINTAAMLDFEVEWLHGKDSDSYLSCDISADYLDKKIKNMHENPSAVYITSPDYLGNMVDIKEIADVCHKHGILLLVDNAHGAYLKFLDKSLHPIDLGADICCDSAHKTLPVLTGGAYLHISKNIDTRFKNNAKTALSMFGSTSPSYIILQSLDMANAYITDEYRFKLSRFSMAVAKCKERLAEHGYDDIGNEPLKITVGTKPYGYTGFEIKNILAEKNIVCEFYDNDFVVLMLTHDIGIEGLKRIEEAFFTLSKKPCIKTKPPKLNPPERLMNVREAVFSENETISAQKSEGRILALSSVGCPPAVPIVVCGERIDKTAIENFKYYGIENIIVVK